jgi:hypothetical protein
MNRLRRFMHLSADLRRLLIEAFFLLAFIRIGLYLTSVERLRRTLKRFCSKSKSLEIKNEAVEKVAYAIHIASSYLPNTNCLPQALAAQVLLTRLAQPAELRIGVARDQSGLFKAHAWVESRGLIVVGGAESPAQFTTLPCKNWESL